MPVATAAPVMQASPLLAVSGLRAGYDRLEVLDGVSLAVGAGEIVCLLGRNGAGKTTTIRAIARLLPLMAGTITLDGDDITGLRPMLVVERGVSVVPEGRHVFAALPVEDNLRLGAYVKRDAWRARIERTYALFPRLAERRKQLAGTLSGGEQQMLAMGRALMSEPRILLLDEPSMGLAPLLIDLVFETIDQLARAGITILLVEQNAVAALDVADRGYVLERGRIVLEDTAEKLRCNDEVKNAYLGGVHY